MSGGGGGRAGGGAWWCGGMDVVPMPLAWLGFAPSQHVGRCCRAMPFEKSYFLKLGLKTSLSPYSCSVERLSNFRNSSILVILACAPVSRRGDPVGRPAPGRAKAASWYCNRGPQQNFRRPGRENYRTRPSKWTISGDFLLVSVAVHLRQRDLAATCGRADAQPPQFYGPTLTHEHVALVRSGVRAGEPCRVGV